MVRLLRVNHGDPGDYTALSYVWGVRNTCTLTSSSLEAYERAIDLASLPKTMKDAICVTRQIGLEYLWIDGVCVIQDLESDKATGVLGMRHYYRNALVLIAASKAATVKEGFFDVRETPLSELGDFGSDKANASLGAQQQSLDRDDNQPFNVPFGGQDHERGTLRIGTRLKRLQAIQRATKSRGWTLQEQLPRRRALNFPSTGGVIWQCDTESALDGSVFFNGLEQGPDRLLRHYIGYSEDARDKVPTNQLHDSWSFVVDEYNNRRLTESADKWIAIAGLAEEYYSHFSKQLGTYLAGHWLNFLQLSLFWHVPKLACQSSSNIYRAPS
jgi:hypothetical protein